MAEWGRAWQGRGMVGVWHGMVGHGRVWVGQKYILKHFRNALFYILLFLPHYWVDDIFLVIFYVRVQRKATCCNLALIMPFVLTLS